MRGDFRLSNMKRLLTLIVVFTTISTCQAETYGFRRDGTGKFPEADPPTTWSTDENVIWKTPMPAASEASPILVGDKIFVCAEMDTLICVNAADGKILWQKGANGYDDVVTSEQADQAKLDQAKASVLQAQLKKLGGELGPLFGKVGAVQTEIQALEAQLKAGPGDPALAQSR